MQFYGLQFFQMKKLRLLKRLSDLFGVTQLVNGRTRISIQVVWFWRPWASPLCYLESI